ncbi:MAG: bifunctional diaminohydroxyphosphoribosylaminopyrimidine deaminase/5-amino-6-(5-phosphoribosylamino)uracil reductase RibD [Deltaproteobacteria bacterium]|nr:bifunctional diaminohydroxyphosphoribosylaminopyrimidine deaminase/5-amino-6-(5-phosphoribosylamino)uracil reductase RibD [Deltaproteobacteria bacterium]
MRMALLEASKGLGRTTPNPAVGAVLVRDGCVVATGFHARAGTDHAEVAALRKIDFRAEGCDLYTTLEPCDHQGRTGSCTEAILAAGIRRVFAGASDPNPLVRGRGLRKLARRGVEIVAGVLGEECERLNEAYNFAVLNPRPFVTLKAGLSLDGRIATSKGESRYITSEASRREVHALRNTLDAVLVGVGTVIADDPELTARLPGARHPRRVIMDRRLRIPLNAKLVATAKDVPTWVMTTRDAPAKKRRMLEARGVEVIAVAAARGGSGVDPRAVLKALRKRELTSVLVEGGAGIHGAFVDARLVDKVVLFYAPLIIGGERAIGAVGGRGTPALADALRIERVSMATAGPDIVITGYPATSSGR